MKTKKKLLGFCVILLAVLATTTLNAQSNSEFKPYWELDLNGGISTFWGDLKQNSILPANKEFNEWKFGGSLMIGRQFSPVFGLRAQILTGELLGGKAELDRYFEANYYEGNINATINFNNLFGDYKPDRLIEFYGVVGIGLTNFNSLLYGLSSGDHIRYQGYGHGKGIGGRTLEGVLLGGMGTQIKINDRFGIKLESVNRGLNSDLLDVWEKGKKYDFYNYTSIGLAYKFGYSKKKVKPMEKVSETLAVVEEEMEVMEEVSSAEATETKEEPKPEPQIKEEPEIIVELEVKEEPVVIPKPKIPEPEYRVQIRACFQKTCLVDQLSKRYNIPLNEIKIDTHNGYYIYTIGSFETYNEARQLRDKVRTVNKVTDAFVVAFSKGKRLSKLPK